ncbi:2-iminobutanoate/2-iminopropanoate deaminase-like [Chrysoperla carnea]|uniref:2-iminobutanoate/2-iminopropanoate deaminase-like n=1 Tax=Chrysoperla carnea TaxID=189513 RepID=UPI001D092883|nr:2-iminobutanoate/2-iminopropanoate deaminase-like [Chrysoperla carnea]
MASKPIIRRTISTNSAPKPVAPYSQAVKSDRTVYISGCVGLDKDTGNLVDGGVQNETRQALINLGNVLKAAGSSYEKVLKTTVFLDDINDFNAVNEVYKEFFKNDFPARTALQVGKLPIGAKIEIEAIASTGDVIQEQSLIITFPSS